MWIEAGDCFARANAPDRAIAAYREALAVAPELSEQLHVVQRIGIQQAKVDAAPKRSSRAEPGGARDALSPAWL